MSFQKQKSHPAKYNLKKAKSSRERRFTILLVYSHGNAQTLSFGLRTLGLLLVCAAIALATLGYFFHSYAGMKNEISQLQYLRQIAEKQHLEIQELQEQYRNLNERLKQTEIVERETENLLLKEGIIPQSSLTDQAMVASLDRRTTNLSSRSAIQRPKSIAVSEMVQALSQLSSDFANLEARISQIEEKANLLREDASRLVAYLRAQPNIWPVSGKVTSPFGWRKHPVTGKPDFHGAIDIAAPYWAPIKVTADGTVVFSGYKLGYGRVVVVDHGFGLKTVYAHCISLKVKKGQKVRRGDVIGYIGDSGTTTGPHLHYEVHKDGVMVDPLKFLRK